MLYAAHWDGLGRCEPVGGDDICNGAVDNATGIAGLIELARHFGGERPTARSVAFVAFTAREHGQLGSAFYAAHPAFAPRLTAGAVNLDALNVFGPARDIGLIGAGRNELETLLAEAAASQQRVIAPASIGERGGFYLGDQFSLAQTGIPVLFPAAGADLYLGGLDSGRAHHEAYRTQRYRKPDDEFSETWDMTGAMRDLQALQMLGRGLAESESWPNWRAGDEFRAARDASRTRR
jgi:Zn-dependent M28 family amino/carboxypeptidase